MSYTNCDVYKCTSNVVYECDNDGDKINKDKVIQIWRKTKYSKMAIKFASCVLYVADELCGPKYSKMTCIFCVHGRLSENLIIERWHELFNVCRPHLLVQNLPLIG